MSIAFPFNSQMKGEIPPTPSSSSLLLWYCRFVLGKRSKCLRQEWTRLCFESRCIWGEVVHILLCPTHKKDCLKCFCKKFRFDKENFNHMIKKQLFIVLSFMILSLTVFSQKTIDRIKLNSGTTYKGRLVSQDSTHIRFRTDEISGLPQTFKIPKSDIAQIIIGEKDCNDTINPITSISGYHEEVKKDFLIKDTGFHLQRGGRFGIAGVSFLIVGSIFEAVGIVKGVPALTYTGVGMSGLGGIFLIVPFGQMIRAGNAYPKRSN